MSLTPQMNSPYKIEGEVLNWGKCICGACGKKGKMGMTTKPTAQRPVVRILCLDCTLQNLSEKHGISIKEAKQRHERSQKAQEVLAKMIMERYREETGKKLPKNMEALSEIAQPGMDWWYNGISDQERERIESLSKDEQKEVFRQAPLLAKPNIPVVHGEQTGRNDPCPCGSGKKYKKCCLDKAA